MKTKLAVFVSGGGSNLQAIIDAIDRGELGAEVALVISSRRHAYALERAARAHIPALVLPPKDYADKRAYSAALLEALAPYEPDLVVLAGFMSVLSADFVARYRGRIMNTHPSLIPAFCGSGFYGDRVHKAVLAYGAKVSGASIIYVEPGVDTGPIILQEAVPVYDDDDVAALAARVLRVEHRLYVRAIALHLTGRLQIEGRRVLLKPIEGGDL